MDARLEDYLRSCANDLTETCYKLFQNRTLSDLARILANLQSSANGELFSLTRLKNMALVMKADISVNDANIQYLRDLFFEFDDSSWRQYMYKNRHLMFTLYSDSNHNRRGGVVIG